jgi:hypothetical protein
MEMHLLWGDYRSGDMGESIHPKKIKILKDSEEKSPSSPLHHRVLRDVRFIFLKLEGLYNIGKKVLWF